MTALFAARAGMLGSKLDVVSGDQEIYSTVPWGQWPKNGFLYLNNTFGKGALVNGKDYVCMLTADKATFPCGVLIEWAWPDKGSGSPYAYGYPELIYGGGPWGNPYGSKGPWPMRVDDIQRLAVSYAVTLGGNRNSYNMLIDLYVTATPDINDGSHIAEISFFPAHKDKRFLTDIVSFKGGAGRCAVYKQGVQLCIQPVTAANLPRSILTATSLDLKEILLHIKSRGWITGQEWLRGAEFGIECQVPNPWNSLPHKGSMLVKTLKYDWA